MRIYLHIYTKDRARFGEFFFCGSCFCCYSFGLIFMRIRALISFPICVNMCLCIHMRICLHIYTKGRARYEKYLLSGTKHKYRSSRCCTRRTEEDARPRTPQPRPRGSSREVLAQRQQTYIHTCIFCAFGMSFSQKLGSSYSMSAVPAYLC